MGKYYRWNIFHDFYGFIDGVWFGKCLFCDTNKSNFFSGVFQNIHDSYEELNLHHPNHPFSKPNAPISGEFRRFCPPFYSISAYILRLFPSIQISTFAKINAIFI